MAVYSESELFLSPGTDEMKITRVFRHNAYQATISGWRI